MHTNNSSISSLYGKVVLSLTTFLVISGTFSMTGVAQDDAGQTAQESSATTIDLEFADASVATILSTLTQMSKVDIIIADDVDARLKNVSLRGKTVEQAIKMVSTAARLHWKKDQGTYFISKNPFANGYSSPLASAATVTPNFTPNYGDTISISSSNNIPDTTNFIPDISGKISENKLTRQITLRNVKPSLMAFWLDPTHHPAPFEVEQDKKLKSEIGSSTEPRYLREKEQARTESRRAELNKQYGAASPIGPGYPVQYPLANPYGYFQPQTYTQFSNQFGNNNNNNRNNNNNNNRNGNGGGSDIGSAAGVIAMPNGIDNIIAIDAQNSLLIQGTGEGIDQIQNIINYLDRPIPQVEIEAQFVEVREGAGKAFGIDYEFTGGRGTGSTNPTEVNNSGLITSTLLPGNISLGYAGRNFTITLQALQTKNLAKVMNAPRLTTFNNMTANLTSLRQETKVFRTRTSTPSESGPVVEVTETPVEFTSGVYFSVTPTVNRDGTITLSMSPTISNFEYDANNPIYPAITSQNIVTSANIKDGDTLAIGGLKLKTVTQADRRIPILSQIPLLGKLLFTSKSQIYSESELIIFVTARVIRRTDEPLPGV